MEKRYIVTQKMTVTGLLIDKEAYPMSILSKTRSFLCFMHCYTKMHVQYHKNLCISPSFCRNIGLNTVGAACIRDHCFQREETGEAGIAQW